MYYPKFRIRIISTWNSLVLNRKFVQLALLWHLRQAAHKPIGTGALLDGPAKAKPSAPGLPAQPQAKQEAKKKAKAKPKSEATKPNYNKKMGNKITQLSTKVTEIRCLLTNVQASEKLSLRWTVLL